MSVKHESVLLLAKMGNYGFSLWQVLWQALFMVKCRGSNIYCTALYCTVRPQLSPPTHYIPHHILTD